MTSWSGPIVLAPKLDFDAPLTIELTKPVAPRHIRVEPHHAPVEPRHDRVEPRHAVAVTVHRPSP